MNAYYNDNDPYCAEWLRNLTAAGLIPPGDVDERSITDVKADDLRGYKQCHFFAGIGGWPLALQLAGWEGPVWTGSCPCQPLSSAGQRKGHADERHLWPAFHAFIAECRPPAVFGEQVASKDGREWLAGLRADLEDLGYAGGAADMPAASVGAPHVRQRLLWFATSYNRIQRTERSREKQIPREPTFSWCKDVRGVTDLRSRSNIPQPLLRAYRDGLPCGMEQVSAYGNSIVPQVAAVFIRAAMM